MNKYAENTLTRLLAKVEPIPLSGCEIFTGSLDTSGYGLIGVGGSGNIRKAHRVSYELRCGPIPDGLQVLHRCDVRCCVNPNHLFLGSLLDNMRDRERKGRGVRCLGSKHGNAKLDELTVTAIKELCQRGMSIKTLANTFEVSRSAIWSIVKSKTWQHVKGNNYVI